MAELALQFHIPQLMFQAYSAWTGSTGQQCLYLGILIGPYLTVMVFRHPPTKLTRHQASPFRASPSHDGPDDDESLFEVDVQHLCDVFPPERAPDLVIYTKHILEDPEDWTMGISAPMRYIFHLATEAVVKSFEPKITQEPSRTFSFEGVPQTSYDVTATEKVTIRIPAGSWGPMHTLL